MIDWLSSVPGDKRQGPFFNVWPEQTDRKELYKSGERKTDGRKDDSKWVIKY